MTPAEVNAEIARLRRERGCAPVSGPMQYGVLVYDAGPLDYCGSWSLAGPLLEEMGGAQLVAVREWDAVKDFEDPPVRWKCTSREGACPVADDRDVAACETPTEAIARAWLAGQEARP